MHPELNKIAIIGASGALGSAFTATIKERYKNASIFAFSRTGPDHIDYSHEESIAEAAEFASRQDPLDLVIFAGGILHEGSLMPEKTLKELSKEKFQRIFEVNTITPALVVKHFLPKLNNNAPSFFAALSARVGSISDNQLGGWYAYRASKSALNMIIKNAAIEISRRNKHATVVGLHPGTVDSALSKPFQSFVPEGKLFTPQYSAQKMLDVLLTLTPNQSGKCFAWDGEEILP